MFRSIFLIITVCALRANVCSLPMEPVCSKFDYEYKTLEAMLRVERHVEDMKKEMEKIQDDVTKKLQEMEDLKQTQERELSTMKQGLGDRSVAAPKSRDDIDGNPTLSTNNGVLLFKAVTTNVGGAYDLQTGKFTCPVDGIYAFVLSIATKREKTDCWCRLKHNNVNVLFSRSRDTLYTTASNTVFLELKKDDVVAPADCYNLEHFYVVNRATSFSGALISKS